MTDTTAGEGVQSKAYDLLKEGVEGFNDLSAAKKTDIHRVLCRALAAQPSAGAQGEAVIGEGELIGDGKFSYQTTLMGERHIVHVETGFTCFKLPYDYRYTDNATQRAHAEKIIAALYATPAQPDTGCKTCGGKGHTEHEGGDSTQSVVEYEECPTCTAQPDTGDVAALREACQPFIDVLADIGESEADEDTFRNARRDHATAPAITVGHIRRLAALSKPNAQGREG